MSIKNIAQHPKERICNNIYALSFNWILAKDTNPNVVIIDNSNPTPKVLSNTTFHKDKNSNKNVA